MQPSISVAEFIRPRPGSRAQNAIDKAIDQASTMNVELVGEIRGEKFYRVRAKGRDRHCVIRWFSQLSQEELASCDCEAFLIPMVPTHCVHVAAVLILETTGPPRKLASMGRRSYSGENQNDQVR